MFARMLLALSMLCGTAQAATIETEIVRGEFVFEHKVLAPGDTTALALDMTMSPGWHTYWKNAGDSGQAVDITWKAPDGVEIGEIDWPTPQRQPFPPMMNYGYSDNSTLLMPVTVSKDWPENKPVELTADVFWLVCKEVCIPEQGSTTVSLPMGETSQKVNGAAAALFRTARAALPIASPYRVSYSVDETSVRFRFEGDHFVAAKIEDIYLFPTEWGVIDHAGTQVASVDPTGLTLTIPRSPENDDAPAGPIGGVVEINEVAGDGPVTLALAFDAQPGTTSGALAAAPGFSGGGERLSFSQAILYALIGGLILNLMPCVFPVLAIKAIGVAENAHMGGGVRAAHGLAYGAGVLALFVGLAALMVGLKSAGLAIGWGFQLQNPIVVVVLAYLFLLIGMNLSGVYEVNTRLSGVGSDAAAQGGLRGSFLTGALAGVVATPCTAPFMAGAMGAALFMTAPQTLAVFAALGFGMALPFILLTLVPGLGSILPRPGAWMVRMKEVLAFPMYATAAWLVWVLSAQTGDFGLLFAMLGGVFVGLAGWAIGTAQRSSGAGRSWGFGTAAVAGVAAVLLVGFATTRDIGPVSTAEAAATSVAEPFSAARLAELRAENTPVFLNMTADWCITCKVNERVALRGAFEQALVDNGVTYLQGDWTRYDAEITALLETFGRAGVPLYAVYPSQGEPVLLPQLLTPDMLVEALSQV